MTKAALEAAIASLETWIQVAAVLVAVGIVGEVGFGVRLWVLSRRLHVIQLAENLDQQEKIALLNKEAGDARRDAGSAIERAAVANERAATLEREVIRLGPRPMLLWGKNRDVAIERLKKFPQQKVEVRYCVHGSNDESISLAMGVKIMAEQSGWSANPVLIENCGGPASLIVTVNPKAPATTRQAASALIKSLVDLSLMTPGHSLHESESPRIPQHRQFVQTGDIQEEIVLTPLEPDRIVVLVFPHP